MLGAVSIRDDDVFAVARGLFFVFSDLIAVKEDKTIVNAGPESVGAARTAACHQVNAS